MKTHAFVLLLLFCYAECRKLKVPFDKNANLDFINMEMGGGVRPGTQNAPAPAPGPAPSKPAAGPPPTSKPASPVPTSPVSPKPVVAPTAPPKPAPAPAPAPKPTPSQIPPKPVNPSPPANPITTPGPGSVKQLINFYDSQGKASPIRPYSYSQAVKQG